MGVLRISDSITHDDLLSAGFHLKSIYAWDGTLEYGTPQMVKDTWYEYRYDSEKTDSTVRFNGVKSVIIYYYPKDYNGAPCMFLERNKLDAKGKMVVFYKNSNLNTEYCEPEDMYDVNVNIANYIDKLLKSDMDPQCF